MSFSSNSTFHVQAAEATLQATAKYAEQLGAAETRELQDSTCFSTLLFGPICGSKKPPLSPAKAVQAKERLAGFATSVEVSAVEDSLFSSLSISFYLILMDI